MAPRARAVRLVRRAPPVEPDLPLGHIQIRAGVPTCQPCDSRARREHEGCGRARAASPQDGRHAEGQASRVEAAVRLHGPSCVAATSAMFRHGVRNLGCVTRNPVRDLDRGDLPSGKRQTKPRYLTVDQVESILSEMTDVFRPVAATCFWTALRASCRFSGFFFFFFFSALARELRTHRERQAKRGFDRIRPDALVFQTSSGKTPGRQTRSARSRLRPSRRGSSTTARSRSDSMTFGTHSRRTRSRSGSPTSRSHGCFGMPTRE